MAFSDDPSSFGWLLESSEDRSLVASHGQEPLCGLGMCTSMWFASKLVLERIGRCTCLNARACVYARG